MAVISSGRQLAGCTATPTLTLGNTEVDVGVYAPPPPSDQKNGTQPLRGCLNNNPCSTARVGSADPFVEKTFALDSNDSRMQQVTWVNGRLWGALDTAGSVSSNVRAGIEWFNLTPSTTTGTVTAALNNQGYLGLASDNLTYPAIGVTSGGTGRLDTTPIDTETTSDQSRNTPLNHIRCLDEDPIDSVVPHGATSDRSLWYASWSEPCVKVGRVGAGDRR